MASMAWLCSLLPLGGAVFRRPNSNEFLLSLGPMADIACTALPLQEHGGPDEGRCYFTVGSAHGLSVDLPWVTCLGKADFLVRPCVAQAPAQAYLDAGCQLPSYLGLDLKQTEDERSMLENAARHAFWQWG